jgi:hypothetical protein
VNSARLQRALMNTVSDGAVEGSGKACWALMRGARADMFWRATRGDFFSVHKAFFSESKKSWTGIGAHPRAPGSPSSQ